MYDIWLYFRIFLECRVKPKFLNNQFLNPEPYNMRTNSISQDFKIVPIKINLNFPPNYPIFPLQISRYFRFGS